jgi:hypothetical protein
MGSSPTPSGSWRAIRGRQGWTREARRQLEQRRWEQPDHVPRARNDRLLLAGERLEAERDAQVAANGAYEDYRKNGRDTQGRRLGRRPKEWVAPEVPEGVVSVTDSDTQRIKARLGYVQRCNAQAVVDEGQIVLAAEITVHAHETAPVPRLTLPQSPFRQFGHEVFCFGQLGRQDQPP